ncbi:MAG: riboflavin biosynthesis protein RibF [Lachnospiraceae bacterium]|nr:riboflavin biosynthesis protein RibF [Lachnospiraceae bacterium]
MELICQTTDFKIEEGCAVAIGKFDGIHRGHKRLLREIFDAKKLGLKTAVFTFDPSPAVFFQGDGVRELMTREEKRIAFEQMGIDYLVEYPFCKETAAIAPEDYVNQFLLDKMNARFIAAGEDVSFGNRGAGNAKLLREIASARGVQVRIISKLCHNGRDISSTYVRSEVEQGNMELVTELMDEPFFISGRVERGNRIGHKLGMPTVNLHPQSQKIMPPGGVYFSTVTYGQQTFYGVTNIGYKPTVESPDGAANRLGVETYIYDFDEDIYEKDIVVHLHHYERGEKKFENLDALKAAIAADVKKGKEYFGI